MFTGCILVMINWFGTSTTCTLSRGMQQGFQGTQPSPWRFNITFDPVHALPSLCACKRGCTTQADMDPTSSSGVADNSLLQTDSPDAIPAMVVVVPMVAGYLRWEGMEENMEKYGVSAVA